MSHQIYYSGNSYRQVHPRIYCGQRCSSMTDDDLDLLKFGVENRSILATFNAFLSLLAMNISEQYVCVHHLSSRSTIYISRGLPACLLLRPLISLISRLTSIVLHEACPQGGEHYSSQPQNARMRAAGLNICEGNVAMKNSSLKTRQSSGQQQHATRHLQLLLPTDEQGEFPLHSACSCIHLSPLYVLHALLLVLSAWLT